MSPLVSAVTAVWHPEAGGGILTRGALACSTKFSAVWVIRGPGRPGESHLLTALHATIIHRPSPPLVQVFAPFVDVTASPTPVLQTIVDATGQKIFSLGFIAARGVKAAWGGECYG